MACRVLPVSPACRKAHGVGTGSLRRQAQLLARRPDIEIVPMRGNVGTRLRKVADGAADATLLALAGLRRLGEEVAGMAVLAPEDMLPAVGQGALGIECRVGDERIQELLQPIVDSVTTAAVQCERALLEVLDGSCRMPIAGLAVAEGRERAAPRRADRPPQRQRLPPSRAGRGHRGRSLHRP